MIAGLLWGMLFGLLFVITHPLILHRGLVQKQSWVLGGLFAFYSLTYALIYFSNPWVREAAPGLAFRWVVFLNGGYVYASIVGIYVGTVFYAIRRSVSIRITIELKKAGGRGLTKEEFDQVYPIDEMVEERLKSMVEAGWLEQEGEYFKVTPKGRKLARIFSFVRETVKIGPETESCVV